MSFNQYHIITADINHLKEAALLFDQYRQFYGQSSNIDAAYNFLAERLKNKESVIYLAIESKTQKTVGFMQLYQSFSSISIERLWVVNDLYVMSDVRNQGIGKTLIEAAQAWVRQQKDKGLSLQTAIHNVSAQKLYSSLGFDLDKKFLHYFWKC